MVGFELEKRVLNLAVRPQVDRAELDLDHCGGGASGAANLFVMNTPVGTILCSFLDVIYTLARVQDTY